MNIRKVKQEEQQQWVSFVHDIFSQDKQVTREYFDNHLRLDPNETFIYVIENENKEWFGTCRVFTRYMYIHNEPILCFGIGEVAIKKEFRSKGFAKQILNHIHLIHGDSNYYVLYSSNKMYQSFVYGKMGYIVVPNSTFSTIITHSQPKSNLYIYQVEETVSNAVEFVKLHKQCKETHENLTVCRENEKYWSMWISSEISRRNATLVTVRDENNYLIGYFIYTFVSESIIQCIEYVNYDKESTSNLMNFLLQKLHQSQITIQGLPMYWKEYFRVDEITEETNCMIRLPAQVKEKIPYCTIHLLDKF